MTKKLYYVKSSKIHGRGIYAKKQIPKGTFIMRYQGERVTKRESEKRRENGNVYIFELNSRYDIDGDIPGNETKYINHACEPNCYTEIINNEIWIIALHDIKKDEELSYDYGYPRKDWQDNPCYCSSKNCFGFMVAKRYRSAIKKTKKYQALRGEH